MNRYTIYCKQCEDDRWLIEIDDDSFMCPECMTVYDSESGVFDTLEAEYYRQLYEGEKRAGLVKDKDGEYV